MYFFSFPKPKLNNAVWGAGLSFSKCHAEKKVPNDPHAPFIFDGVQFIITQYLENEIYYILGRVHSGSTILDIWI